MLSPPAGIVLTRLRGGGSSWRWAVQVQLPGTNSVRQHCPSKNRTAGERTGVALAHRDTASSGSNDQGLAPTVAASTVRKYRGSRSDAGMAGREIFPQGRIRAYAMVTQVTNDGITLRYKASTVRGRVSFETLARTKILGPSVKTRLLRLEAPQPGQYCVSQWLV